MKTALHFCIITLALVISTCVYSAPTVVVLFKGGGPSGSDGTNVRTGMNDLNTSIRNEFLGYDFYTRTFEYTQQQEAINFINTFDSSANIIEIGHSRGGFAALQVADYFNGQRNIKSLIQLDSFACYLGCADRFFDVINGNDPITSFRSQSVSDNVLDSINYYQKVTSYDQNLAQTQNAKGYLLQGEINIGGATNTDIEALFNDTTITHMDIDDNTRLQRKIIDSIKPTLSASTLITGLGGSSGFGELVMGPNDDGSSNQIQLPFSAKLGDIIFNSFYVNNNGNLTFNSPLGEFTPEPFPIANQPMIAPFWGDVDTRGVGEVYVAAPTSDTVVVTWSDVGYYDYNSDKTNTFQVVIRDRSDAGLEGSFDVEYHYSDLNWTTGDASGGSGGLGGTPAQAGYDKGDGSNAVMISGSRTSEVINLVSSSNIGLPGIQGFHFIEGEPPGNSPANPLLPDVMEDGWHFDFNIGNPNQTIYIDPNIAVGYEYTVTTGSNISAAIFPIVAGDTDGYQVFSLIGELLGTVMPDEWFDFGSEGINGFRLLDIDADPSLDPNDTLAFVTGLTFISGGHIQMSQVPITFNTDGIQNVPEPSTFFLFCIGALVLVSIQSKRHFDHAKLHFCSLI